MTSAPQREFAVTLVRHGESSWNALGLVQGQNNESRLTAHGRQQARHVADSLQEMGFDALISSDLDRASETATLIGERLGLTPTLEPLLRERCFGDFEGGPVAELTSAVTGHDQQFIVDPDARPPRGESLRDMVHRAEMFLEVSRREHPKRNLLVVTHGGMVHALRAYPFRDSLEGVAWYAVGNCSVWPLDFIDVT